MHARTVASLLLTCGFGIAQSAIPFPLATAGALPGGPLRALDNRTFASPASRTQLLYDVAAVPAPAAVWSSLQLRMPTGPALNLAYLANATVAVGMSPAPPASAAAAFASNLPAPSTVFTGMLSLPVRTATATWPQAWEAAVPFAAPYVYIAAGGQALVVEVAQTAVFGSGWSLEAWVRNLGQVELGLTVQPACKFGAGFFVGNPSNTSVVVGGTWGPTVSPLPPNLVGLGALGALGPGSVWNGTSLPIDLAPLGAPGCVWGVSIDIVLPLASSPAGICVWPQVPIPNLPGLVGSSFYEQAVFVDPTANALGRVALMTNRWTVAGGLGAPGTTVVAVGAGAATATSGVVNREVVATLRMN